MKRLTIALAALAITSLASTSAFAQQEVSNDAFSATTEMPEGWEEVSGNDRAVFNFKQAESQSQIEVIATRLMTADVASDFFETFHETLRNSGFTADSATADKDYGDQSGQETVYSFTHTDINLKVPVFQFVEGNVAWLVIGYIQADALDEYKPALAAVAESLSIED